MGIQSNNTSRSEPCLHFSLEALDVAHLQNTEREREREREAATKHVVGAMTAAQLTKAEAKHTRAAKGFRSHTKRLSK